MPKKLAVVEPDPFVGKTLPTSTVSVEPGGEATLATLSTSQYLVLYFYPKDMTPGCTTQAVNFTDMHGEFTDAGAVIVGCSPDTIKRHQRFIQMQSIPYTLIADTEKTLAEELDVMREKSMYGKKYRGVDRSTFLCNAQGEILKVWRKVRPKGHAREVLETIQAL